MAHQLIQFNHIYTDFEFVGNIQHGPEDCQIWHIGAVRPNGETFEVYINVDTNYDTHPGCVNVTKKYLAEHNAVDFSIALRRFANWVGPQAVIISHNCFRSDKPVLENECLKNDFILPCWYFYDSLLFLRSKIQCISYRLPDVYQTITGKVFNSTHTALLDAQGLKEILEIVQPAGLYMYPKYLTPLQNIKWIGAACEEALVNAGVRSVEELILRYKQWVILDACVTTLMMQFLSQFSLPAHDLSPIATELVTNWLPKTHGGGKK